MRQSTAGSERSTTGTESATTGRDRSSEATARERQQDGVAGSPSAVGALHAAVGNQALSRDDESAGPESNLTVRRRDHPVEREASRAVDAVLGRAGPGAPVTVRRRSRAPAIREGGPTVPGHVARTIRDMQGGGRALDTSTRSYFEARFGENFGGVRVHTGPRAAEAAAAFDAAAFTVGRDVAFAAGMYRPGTRRGKGLLAHELAHVVQHGTDGEFAARSSGTVVHRAFPVELPNPGVQPRPLTDAEIREAIDYNRHMVSQDAEIEELRDMLGVGRQPPEIDEAFVRGVVRFQAQADLTEDGKLGPVTASRLSDQFQATASFLGPAGDEARREALRLNAKSLTIRVVQPPNELNDTGSVEYGVQWEISDPQANGWVIQHVTWSAEKRDCHGNDLPTNNSDGLDFWEGWEVRDGDVYIGSTNSRHNADTFRTVDEGGNTEGEVTIDGHVTFMPGYDLQQPPWGHGVPAAGALPTRRDAPDGWSDGFARHHYLEVEWDDCAHPPTQDVDSKP